MIGHVIFDLDGTLLDTREGILESVRYAAEQLRYPALPHETLLSFIGPPIQQSFMTHYGCSLEQAQEAAGIFRDYYKDSALLRASPYDGIYDLCSCLQSHGVRMAVATYKREDYALTLLRYFHFDRYCDPMHGADHENRLKKEDIISLCMAEMSASKADTVLVGDTTHDAKGALEAGIPFIGVTYGFGFQTPEDVDAYPSIGTANSPMDIAAIVLKEDLK